MKTSRTLIFGAFGLLAAVILSSCSSAGNNSTASSSATPSQTPGETPSQVPSLAPVQTTSGTVQAPLADDFNLPGIYPDGVQFSGGVDGDGFACSSNLLGAAASWNGLKFAIGSASPKNVISCQGQTISLPAGTYSKLVMLAMAVNGAQAGVNFTVTYADGSTQSLTQSLSDWASPDNNPGESTAVTMDYRLQSDGSRDENTFYIFGYSFDLNSKSAVKSLQLPDNNDVKIFAITLVP